MKKFILFIVIVFIANTAFAPITSATKIEGFVDEIRKDGENVYKNLSDDWIFKKGSLSVDTKNQVVRVEFFYSDKNKEFYESKGAGQFGFEIEVIDTSGVLDESIMYPSRDNIPDNVQYKDSPMGDDKDKKSFTVAISNAKELEANTLYWADFYYSFDTDSRSNALPATGGQPELNLNMQIQLTANLYETKKKHIDIWQKFSLSSREKLSSFWFSSTNTDANKYFLIKEPNIRLVGIFGHNNYSGMGWFGLREEDKISTSDCFRLPYLVYENNIIKLNPYIVKNCVKDGISEVDSDDHNNGTNGGSQNNNSLNQDLDRDGYTVTQGDCSDNNKAIYPGAIDICDDGIDQDCSGSDKICESNVHITHHHIRPYDTGSWHEKVDAELAPGESFAFHTEARVENRSSHDLKDIDIDYCVTNKKNFNIPSSEKKKLDGDQVDIKKGEKENKTLRRSTASISSDGKTLIIATDGKNSFNFPISKEEKVAGEKTVYFFIDVKTKDAKERDVSSEQKSDEYGKLTIKLISVVSRFTANKTSGTIPLAVNFSDSSMGEGLTYLWNFGDGTTSTEKNPSHTFTKVGKFNVDLTVTNNIGVSKTKNLIIITEAQAPSVNITSPSNGQTWKSSNEYNIKWTSSNLSKSEPIKIEYSCDGGKIWKTIYDGYTTNDGSKKWTMKKSKTKDYKNSYIRILRSSDNKVLGVSRPFAIDHKSGTPDW